MGMEISGIHADYVREYPQVDKVDKTEKSEKIVEAEKQPQDEYISSEKSGNKISGLYSLLQDADGNRRIVYEDPHKQPDAPSGVKAVDEKEKASKGTTNTDAVDREIARLKQEKQQLLQQIYSVHGDAEKKKELEQKLTQIENELAQKDNDAYRRQNAVKM